MIFITDCPIAQSFFVGSLGKNIFSLFASDPPLGREPATLEPRICSDSAVRAVVGVWGRKL